MIKTAVDLFGLQIKISSFFGSIPYRWDSQKQQLWLVKPKSFLYWKWVFVTILIWIHHLTIIVKIGFCYHNKCLGSQLETTMHLALVNMLLFPTIFNYNTVVDAEQIKLYINKLIQNEKYLTSELQDNFNSI